MSKKLNFKKGETVIINIPFTYTIGEIGYETGKTLKTIEDCENEVRAELDNGSITGNEVFLEVADNKLTETIKELLQELIYSLTNQCKALKMSDKEITDTINKNTLIIKTRKLLREF